MCQTDDKRSRRMEVTFVLMPVRCAMNCSQICDESERASDGNRASKVTNRADITVEATKAVMKVMKNPRH